MMSSVRYLTFSLFGVASLTACDEVLSRLDATCEVDADCLLPGTVCDTRIAACATSCVNDGDCAGRLPVCNDDGALPTVPAVCVCSADSCAAGEVCGPDGLCSPSSGCSRPGEVDTCEAGQICRDDLTCGPERPGCGTPGERGNCGAGQICQADGTCVEEAQPECTMPGARDTCGVGEICQPDLTCGPPMSMMGCGQTGTLGRCADLNETCQADGTCRPDCRRVPTLCQSGEMCDGQGFCQPVMMTGCGQVGSSDLCPPGELCGSAGACEPVCDDRTCLALTEPALCSAAMPPEPTFNRCVEPELVTGLCPNASAHQRDRAGPVIVTVRANGPINVPGPSACSVAVHQYEAEIFTRGRLPETSFYTQGIRYLSAMGRATFVFAEDPGTNPEGALVTFPDVMEFNPGWWLVTFTICGGGGGAIFVIDTAMQESNAFCF